MRRIWARLMVRWHLFWLVRDLRKWLRMIGHEG
jgi:hypothetical protein